MSDRFATGSVHSQTMEPRPLPSDNPLKGMNLTDLGRVWFIGIGGSGMSVLALMLHEEGVRVAGSDREESHYSRELEKAGIRVVIGQKASNIHDVDTVVWSTAIPANEAEMAEARRQHLLLAHRSDILALLLRTRRSIAVAGTHGKTTTSSMVAAILSSLDPSTDRKGVPDASALADPSFAIGGSLKTPNGVVSGGHAGKGKWMVAEADESDGSFAKYTPLISIITNAEGDHLDHYRTVARYRQAFGTFASHSRGVIVLCGDDEGARQVYSRLDENQKARTIVYTTNPRVTVPAGHLAVISDAHEIADQGTGPFGGGSDEDASTALRTAAKAHPLMEEFTLSLPDGLHVKTAYLSKDVPACSKRVHLCVPGLHNARNAAAAILATTLAGLPFDEAVRRVGMFLGAARRFDFQGQYDGIRLYTDYGHHPTEVATFLTALRARYPRRPIRVLFQPHSFSRVRNYAAGYAKALALADEAVLVPVFPAREKQEDFPGITSATILHAAHGSPHFVLTDSLRAGADRLFADSRPGDVLATIGAGSIEEDNPLLLADLRKREKKDEARQGNGSR